MGPLVLLRPVGVEELEEAGRSGSCAATISTAARSLRLVARAALLEVLELEPEETVGQESC